MASYLFKLPIDFLPGLWYNRNSVRLGRRRTAKKAPPIGIMLNRWGFIHFQLAMSGATPKSMSYYFLQVHRSGWEPTPLRHTIQYPSAFPCRELPLTISHFHWMLTSFLFVSVLYHIWCDLPSVFYHSTSFFFKISIALFKASSTTIWSRLPPVNRA